MKKEMLYKELAQYYDLIYSSKNYRNEVKLLKELITKHKKSTGKELLDVACGTGKHLAYLKKDFSCVGVDSNESMLKIAKKNVSGVTFKKMNMMRLHLNNKFDVLLCMFSSIGYAKTYKNLNKTINNFAKHLKKGGILILELWISKKDFKVGRLGLDRYEGKDLKIARVGQSRIRGNISILDMHYLIAEKGKEIKHFAEQHELGLFRIEKIMELMMEAGLKAIYVKKGLIRGRGLVLGVKE